MDSERRVNKVFNDNYRGCRLRGRPKKKTDGEIVHKQILADVKLQIGKRGKKIELTGRSALWRRRSELDCSAI
jgi:hypothetical protein